MKKRLFSFLLVLMLALGLTPGVAAQNYFFTLEREVVDVFINADGTLSLQYAFTFANSPGASPIDFVDVGMPNGYYDYSSIEADVDGNPVSISSDYQGNGSHGVAVDLGSRAIQPGQRGTVNVTVGRIQRMLFPDDNDENYASMNFSPTWFGSQFVQGNTNLIARIHLPPGVKPEEPRYHLAKGDWPCEKEPQAALSAEGRIVYTWQCGQANGYTQYTFGASFPAQYVPEGAITTPSIWDALGIDEDTIIGFFFFCCFGGIFFGSPVIGAINEHKRKKQYLPPKIAIEGRGIKRGLTAVEAAILMGQPLEKVMTMVLFGVIKKNAAEVTKRDPLELKVIAIPEELREYETQFLKAFQKEKAAERRKALQTMTVNLVKAVGGKMKGFSRKETLEYYKSINEKAWSQIAAADTPEVQSQLFEEALEWTMLDSKYDERAQRTFSGPVYVPSWWGRYDPVYRAPATGGGLDNVGSPISMGGGPASLPGADFAASVVTGTQNFASRVLGGNFTEGVTKVTNPPPVSSSSGGSSGGSGCACACACAGCACACAGGGR